MNKIEELTFAQQEFEKRVVKEKRLHTIKLIAAYTLSFGLSAAAVTIGIISSVATSGVAPILIAFGASIPVLAGGIIYTVKEKEKNLYKLMDNELERIDFNETIGRAKLRSERLLEVQKQLDKSAAENQKDVNFKQAFNDNKKANNKLDREE